MRNISKFVFIPLIYLLSLSSCSSGTITLFEGYFTCSYYEEYNNGIKVADENYEGLVFILSEIDKDTYDANENKEDVIFDEINNKYYYFILRTDKTGPYITYKRSFYELTFYEKTSNSVTYIDKFLSTITCFVNEDEVYYEIKYMSFLDDFDYDWSLEGIKNYLGEEDYQLYLETYRFYRYFPLTVNS